MEMHLEKNTPREDEIALLSTLDDKEAKYDHDKDSQWDGVSKTYSRMVSNLTETAIERQNSEIVNTGLFVLENIAFEVMDMDLGDLQKTSIIKGCYYFIQKLVLKCVDEGLYRKRTIRPQFAFIDNSLNKKAKFSNIPLITFSDILIQLAKKKLLDSSLLNNLGTWGRYSIDKIEEDAIYKDSVLFVIKTFDKIKKITEEDLTEENKHIYIEINTQLNLFRRWMDKYKKKYPDVQIALTKVINSFSQLDQIKGEFEKGTITWEN